MHKLLKSSFVALCTLAFVFSLFAASPDKPEPTKPCFQCYGHGYVNCTEPSCVKGQADCPGPCLKLDHGVWKHEHVDNHPDSDLWISFPNGDGTSHMWNQNHVGDVIDTKNGPPRNIGKCEICKGTGRVTCTTCSGTGHVKCPLCEGRKVVPASWTAFDNPKLKNRPAKFVLKDGRTIVGRTAMVMGGYTTIRTATNQIEVNTADIISQPPP